MTGVSADLAAVREALLETRKEIDGLTRGMPSEVAGRYYERVDGRLAALDRVEHALREAQKEEIGGEPEPTQTTSEATSVEVASSGFAITRGKGFHLRFENGWTASVQFGPYNYSSNYDGPASTLAAEALALGASSDVEATTAEIAAWLGSDWYDFGDDMVAGYKTPAEVLSFLVEVAALPASATRSGEAATPELQDLGDEPEGSSSAEELRSAVRIARAVANDRYASDSRVRGCLLAIADLAELVVTAGSSPQAATPDLVAAFPATWDAIHAIRDECESLRAALVAAEAERDEWKEAQERVCSIAEEYRQHWDADHRSLLAAQARIITLEKALRPLLDRYVALVASGDCGSWDAEKEDEIVAARAALAATAADLEQEAE